MRRNKGFCGEFRTDRRGSRMTPFSPPSSLSSCSSSSGGGEEDGDSTDEQQRRMNLTWNENGSDGGGEEEGAKSSSSSSSSSLLRRAFVVASPSSPSSSSDDSADTSPEVNTTSSSSTSTTKTTTATKAARMAFLSGASGRGGPRLSRKSSAPLTSLSSSSSSSSSAASVYSGKQPLSRIASTPMLVAPRPLKPVAVAGGKAHVLPSFETSASSSSSSASAGFRRSNSAGNLLSTLSRRISDEEPPTVTVTAATAAATVTNATTTTMTTATRSYSSANLAAGGLALQGQVSQFSLVSESANSSRSDSPFMMRPAVVSDQPQREQTEMEESETTAAVASTNNDSISGDNNTNSGSDNNNNNIQFLRRFFQYDIGIPATTTTANYNSDLSAPVLESADTLVQTPDPNVVGMPSLFSSSENISMHSVMGKKSPTNRMMMMMMEDDNDSSDNWRSFASAAEAAAATAAAAATMTDERPSHTSFQPLDEAVHEEFLGIFTGFETLSGYAAAPPVVAPDLRADSATLSFSDMTIDDDPVHDGDAMMVMSSAVEHRAFIEPLQHFKQENEFGAFPGTEQSMWFGASPPSRSENPLCFNTPFMASHRAEGIELGLFSPSPPMAFSSSLPGSYTELSCSI